MEPVVVVSSRCCGEVSPSPLQGLPSGCALGPSPLTQRLCLCVSGGPRGQSPLGQTANLDLWHSRPSRPAVPHEWAEGRKPEDHE